MKIRWITEIETFETLQIFNFTAAFLVTRDAVIQNDSQWLTVTQLPHRWVSRNCQQLWSCQSHAPRPMDCWRLTNFFQNFRLIFRDGSLCVYKYVNNGLDYCTLNGIVWIVSSVHKTIHLSKDAALSHSCPFPCHAWGSRRVRTYYRFQFCMPSADRFHTSHLKKCQILAGMILWSFWSRCSFLPFVHCLQCHALTLHCKLGTCHHTKCKAHPWPHRTRKPLAASSEHWSSTHDKPGINEHGQHGQHGPSNRRCQWCHYHPCCWGSCSDPWSGSMDSLPSRFQREWFFKYMSSTSIICITFWVGPVCTTYHHDYGARVLLSCFARSRFW